MSNEDVPSWEMIWNDMEGEKIYRLVYGKKRAFLALSDEALEHDANVIKKHMINLILDGDIDGHE